MGFVSLLLAAMFSQMPLAAVAVGGVAPYPSAPACPTHDPMKFHKLWDWSRGCHYDHEHGDNPFTQAATDAFPGVDLRALLGDTEVGLNTYSSQAEPTTKHSGFKYTVALNVPCVPFESAAWCVTDAVIEYHAFGDNQIELETRKHSAAALVKVRDPSDSSRTAILFVAELQDYGQRVAPYQGQIVPYPDSPAPAYASALGPYWSIDPFGSCAGCRVSPEQVCQGNLNNNETVTSKGTGATPKGGTSPFQALLNILFRVRDASKLLEWASVADGYPFTFTPVCPGLSRYNNSTSRAHEVAGVVPAAWDNLAGWDTEPQIGRVSVDGYVTASGQPLGFCQPGQACYRIQFDRAFVGKWGGNLCPTSKCANTTTATNPERDIYFCGQVVCAETDTGAMPSGWIGAQN